MKEISEKLRNIILSAIPTDNLVLFYAPLYGTNPTIKCRVSSDNDGTFTNPKWKTLKNGLVVPDYAFTAYIKNSTANWRSGDSQGAIGVWFMGTPKAQRTLFNSSDEATDVRYVAWRTDPTGFYLEIAQRNNDTPDILYGSTVINDGKWHSGFVTSDGSAYALYVDGGAETLTVRFGANTGDWFADTANRDNFAVGAHVRTTIANPWGGQIGLVVVYSVAPSVAQILRMHNRLKEVFH